jgi:hypothetical protein
MSDFGGGRTYPLNPKNNGPVVEGVTVITADGTGIGNLMADDSIEMKTMILEPNWPSVLRWHLNAMATDSFNGYDGRRAALRSIVDMVRYMASKPELRSDLNLILEEYSS